MLLFRAVEDADGRSVRRHGSAAGVGCAAVGGVGFSRRMLVEYQPVRAVEAGCHHQQDQQFAHGRQGRAFGGCLRHWSCLPCGCQMLSSKERGDVLEHVADVLLRSNIELGPRGVGNALKNRPQPGRVLPVGDREDCARTGLPGWGSIAAAATPRQRRRPHSGCPRRQSGRRRRRCGACRRSG